MTKKHEGGLVPKGTVFAEIDPVETFILVDKKEKPLFKPVLWSGILPTFQCETCGHCDPDKDEMILHVLTHVPENDRNGLLEKLTKE
jgi:hypothetical protein